MKTELNLHPLVEKTKKSVNKSYLDKGCIRCGRNGLDIRVSPHSLDRALRVMNTVIENLEKKGVIVFINETEHKTPTCVKICEETLSIDIYEKINIIEKKEKRDYFDYGRYDYIPNGDLVLRIKDGPYDIRSEWKDGQRKKLENQIDSFIDGLFLAAEKKKDDRLERERERREWEEKERKKEEEERKRQQEKARVDMLEKEAMCWHRSKIIRSYVEAATAAYIEKDGKIEPGSEFDQWKAWANQQADNLDPLTEKLNTIKPTGEA